LYAKTEEKAVKGDYEVDGTVERSWQSTGERRDHVIT